MRTKINDLSELSNILRKSDRIDTSILNFTERFNVNVMLKSFEAIKLQGFCFLSVLSALVLIRLGGVSVYAASRLGGVSMDDNTFYRLMNDGRIDWRKLLLCFAVQFTRVVKRGTEVCRGGIRCFVLDDTVLEKSGKTIDGISRVHNHTTGGFCFGFKMLLLGYFDGKMLVPADMSFHRESRKSKYGLKDDELKRQYKTRNAKGSCGEQRKGELDRKKTDVAVEMIKRAVRKGLLASYVLMDSWFTNEEVIKQIRKIGKGALHVVGMCKMDSRKFVFESKEHKSDLIIRKQESRGKARCSTKYKSRYIAVEAVYKGIPVKLFYVKYKRAKNWTLILSTDTGISFNRAMEIYQIRWTVEVLFKESKQYLRLGKSQNTNFNGQVADTTLALVSYNILSLEKRFGSYETMGELFRTNQREMLERTISERIMEAILQLVMQLLEFLAIDIDGTMRSITGDKSETRKLILLLNAVNQIDENDLTKNKDVA